ncbi:hypothetical protein [Roseovarius aestuarii]|nr:hypothetical protein [Roseovarius aestuarii]
MHALNALAAAIICDVSDRRLIGSECRRTPGANFVICIRRQRAVGEAVIKYHQLPCIERVFLVKFCQGYWALEVYFIDV